MSAMDEWQIIHFQAKVEIVEGQRGLLCLVPHWGTNENLGLVSRNTLSTGPALEEKKSFAIRFK